MISFELTSTFTVLKNCLNKKVVSSILYYYPLYCNEDKLNMMYKLVLNLNDNSIIEFFTSGNEWTINTKLLDSSRPYECYSFNDFEKRINFWKSIEDDDFIFPEYEGFILDKSSCDFIGKKISKIYLLNIDNEELNPFGVKLCFENNITLYSFSYTNGNSIKFNGLNDSIDIYSFNDFLGKTFEININSIT